MSRKSLWCCLGSQWVPLWHGSALHLVYSFALWEVWNPVLCLHWLGTDPSHLLPLQHISVLCFKLLLFHRKSSWMWQEATGLNSNTSFFLSQMVESLLMHNLPLFCLSSDQQFTISVYKDFLKLVLRINLYLDYQLYSLLNWMFLVALIVKCVHIRTDTILSFFSVHLYIYFLIFKTAYFDSVAFILGVLLYPICRLYFPFPFYATVVKPTKDPPLLRVWQVLPCKSVQCLHKTESWEKLFSSVIYTCVQKE